MNEETKKLRESIIPVGFKVPPELKLERELADKFKLLRKWNENGMYDKMEKVLLELIDDPKTPAREKTRLIIFFYEFCFGKPTTPLIIDQNIKHDWSSVVQAMSNASKTITVEPLNEEE